MATHKNNYDVIIIGGGIAGLVSANYLVRKGLSVLLIEAYERVGGCCSSFNRDGFSFDVGVHYFGSLRESGGQLRKIFDELELHDKLKITRFTPNDVIVMPDFKVKIFNDLSQTIDEFSSQFPSEAKNISSFFNWIVESNFLHLFLKTRDISFRNLLDSYFNDEKLKQTLTAPLGNIGLSAVNAAAITSIVLYREYLLDGGYYPLGGVQQFPNILESEFRNKGGDLLLSQKVKKIVVKNRKTQGIELEHGVFIASNYVISACDAQQTYFNLVGKENIPDNFESKLRVLKPSMSAFIVYLGLNKSLETVADHCSHWFSPNYQVDDFYDDIFADKFDIEKSHFLSTFCSFHDSNLAPATGEAMTLFVGAPCFNDSYWQKTINEYSAKLISMAEKYFGDFSPAIKLKQIATPKTIFRYTSNSNGALYGWAPTNYQIQKGILPGQCEFIEGLYLAGHWVTQGYAQGGVPVVALAGRAAANSILKKMANNKKAFVLLNS